MLSKQQTKEVLHQLRQISQKDNIKGEDIVEIFIEAFYVILREKFGSDVEFIIESKNDELHFYRSYDVVKVAENTILTISLDDAKKINPAIKIGEKLQKPLNISEVFSRSDIGKFTSVFNIQKGNYLKKIITTKYEKLVGKLVYGEMQIQQDDKYVINLGDANGIIRYDRLIPKEELSKSRQQAFLLKTILIDKNFPRIVLDRRSDKFILELIHEYVPEVTDKVVIVNDIKRLPGVKTKVSVSSTDKNVDPVHACLGIDCCRQESISNEANKEKIEFFIYDDNPNKFINNFFRKVKIAYILETSSQIPNISSANVAKWIYQKMQGINNYYTIIVPDSKIKICQGFKSSNYILLFRFLYDRWESGLNIISVSEAKKLNIIDEQEKIILNDASISQETIDEKGQIVKTDSSDSSHSEDKEKKETAPKPEEQKHQIKEKKVVAKTTMVKKPVVKAPKIKKVNVLEVPVSEERQKMNLESDLTKKEEQKKHSRFKPKFKKIRKSLFEDDSEKTNRYIESALKNTTDNKEISSSNTEFDPTNDFDEE